MGAGVIGALLRGSAQGFLKEKQRQKLQTQVDKAKQKQNRLRFAEIILKDPNATEDAKKIALGVSTGDTKFERQFDELAGQGEISLPSIEQIPDLETTLAPGISDESGRITPNQQARAGLAPEGEVEPGVFRMGFEPEVPAIAPEAAPAEGRVQLFRDPEEQAREAGRLKAITELPALQQRAELSREEVNRTERETNEKQTAAILEVVGDDDTIAAKVQSRVDAGQSITDALKAEEQGGATLTELQVRNISEKSIKSAFFGRATIAEVRANIEEAEMYTDLELRGLQAEARLERQGKEAAAAKAAGTVTKAKARDIFNRALGVTRLATIKDPKDIFGRGLRIPLVGEDFDDRLDNEILKRGFDPVDIRDLIEEQRGQQQELPTFEGRRPAQVVPFPTRGGETLPPVSSKGAQTAVDLFNEDVR